MSSILEALRELEGERPPTARREIPPPEKPPSIARRATGVSIPIVGGLAVGVVVFALVAWGPGLLGPMTSSDTSSSVAPAAPSAPAAPPPAETPTWLDKADAPRARVNRGAPASPDRPVNRARAESAAADPAPAETRDDPKASSSGGQVAVESISYSDDAGGRVATIRFRGRRVTLRQRESIDGIEVQLILPNGVYVQRGGEVYLLPLSR